MEDEDSSVPDLPPSPLELSDDDGSSSCCSEDVLPPPPRENILQMRKLEEQSLLPENKVWVDEAPIAEQTEWLLDNDWEWIAIYTKAKAAFINQCDTDMSDEDLKFVRHRYEVEPEMTAVLIHLAGKHTS